MKKINILYIDDIIDNTIGEYFYKKFIIENGDDINFEELKFENDDTYQTLLEKKSY